MIVWPEESRLKSESRQAIKLLRDAAAAAELETSKETWTVVAWPWSTDLPIRVLFENASRHIVSLTMREGGIWLSAEEPRDYHIRSAETNERDARGLR